jgi:hypothetical protein
LRRRSNPILAQGRRAGIRSAVGHFIFLLKKNGSGAPYSVLEKEKAPWIFLSDAFVKPSPLAVEGHFLYERLTKIQKASFGYLDAFVLRGAALPRTAPSPLS